MNVSTETATVYRGGGRRYLTKRANPTAIDAAAARCILPAQQEVKGA